MSGGGTGTLFKVVVVSFCSWVAVETGKGASFPSVIGEGVEEEGGEGLGMVRVALEETGWACSIPSVRTIA